MKIFNDSEDKYIAANVIYSDDMTHFFYELDETRPVDPDDYLNLFLKGVVVINTTDGVMLTPIGFRDGDFVFGNSSNSPDPINM